MFRHLFILIFLFLISLPCFCQETDVELWLAAQVRKDLGEKFRIYYEQGYRRDEFLEHIKTANFEAGGYYKPFKFLWLGSYYRFSTNFSDFIKNRFSCELVLRRDIKRLYVKSRSQYNADFVKGDKTDHYARERILLEYDIRKCKLSPFFASEAIFHMQRDKSENEQIRFDLGIEWKLGKRHTIDTFYRYRIKRNVKNPLRSNIIGIDYVFEF